MNIDDQAVTQYNQAIAPLADSLQHASELLGQIEQPLGQLYQQAEAADDQAAIAQISIAWGLTQDLANQLPPFVDALRAGGAALKEMRNQRNDFARELNQLIEALESFDTSSDPRLAKFAEVLESEIWEYASDSLFEDALEAAEEYAFDTLDEQFHEYLYANYDTSHLAIGSLLEYLRGEADDYRDEQKQAIIQELVNQFKPEVMNDVR